MVNKDEYITSMDHERSNNILPVCSEVKPSLAKVEKSQCENAIMKAAYRAVRLDHTSSC